MVEAEPVIRAVLPDASVPTSIRDSGIPVTRGAASELGSILDGWLAAHADGIACVIGDLDDGALPAMLHGGARVRSLTPRAIEGARVRPGRAHRRRGVRPWRVAGGLEAAVDRYVAMTRATQQLVVLTGC